MREVFPGYFRPKKEEFGNYWDSSIFVFDANVLLNLYRYSSATRKELQDAITSLKGRIYISHQAASEFLKNRLTVTSDQSKEYTSAINSIKDLLKKISSKDRHPFVDDSKLEELNSLAPSLIDDLEKHQKILMDKLSNDEILDFVEGVFSGKTGKPYDKERLEKILEQGKERFELKIPPGYKDINKDSTDDAFRKYGDLIVWLQTIDHAKDLNKSVVFITDDKKEDWWLEQSGRTIGPRPELIEEFKKETSQNFWMYSVSKFIKEAAEKNQKEVSTEIFDEIRTISERMEKVRKEHQELFLLYKNKEEPSIKVSQETNVCNVNENSGVVVVTLAHDMRYATGSGKFKPELVSVPEFYVEFIVGPEDAEV